MNMITILLVAAATFGVCWLFDKGYTNTFRNKIQHRTGLAVRLSKRYAVFGLLLTVLGIAAIFTGLGSGKALLYGGIFVLLWGLWCTISPSVFSMMTTPFCSPPLARRALHTALRISLPSSFMLSRVAM